jgi:nucleolar GTP-binding protein
MAEKTFKIPTVLTSEELTDKAFSRSAKIFKNGTNSLDTKKKTTLAKITASGDIIVTTLSGYVERFPRIEKEDGFFPELVNLVIGLDQYKKSLGAMNWAAGRTEKLKNESLRNVRRSKDENVIDAVRSSFYGRLSSLLRQISKDLEFLQEAKNKFRKLPHIEPDVPTAVIAGFPNVGKSSLVRKLSTAVPVIAPYPFTTKGIIIGHMEDSWRRYQIIDTPGLLDRSLDERNDIEKQAVLALKYLTNVLVFILDPSETCGYPMEKQLALLSSVKTGFSGIPMMVVESKSDVCTSSSGNMKFSADTGYNMDALTEELKTKLRAVRF